MPLALIQFTDMNIGWMDANLEVDVNEPRVLCGDVAGLFQLSFGLENEWGWQRHLAVVVAPA